MELTFRLDRDEVTRALTEFLPMRLLLGSLDGVADPPWLQIEAVQSLAFVPERGLRITCEARVHYPLPLLPDDFTVQHVSLEMTPTIVLGAAGPMLVFALDIDDVDVKFLPAFVDRSITRKVNLLLREHADSIAWHFGATIGRTIDLPARFERVRALTLGEPRGVVEVSEAAILLRLVSAVSFGHAAEPDPAPGAGSTDDAAVAAGPVALTGVASDLANGLA